MATTKKDFVYKVKKRTFKHELAKHIPDLWKYAKVLSTNDDKAYALLSDTIKRALAGLEAGCQKAVDYTALSRLMYRQFIDSNAQMAMQPVRIPVHNARGYHSSGSMLH